MMVDPVFAVHRTDARVGISDLSPLKLIMTARNRYCKNSSIIKYSCILPRELKFFKTEKYIRRKRTLKMTGKTNVCNDEALYVYLLQI